MNKGLVTQLIAIIAVVGFLCFAGGYLVAGGITRQSGQYAYGENIQVNVVIADLDIDQQVIVYSGMTPFDALAKCAAFKTAYYESFGASIVTDIGGLEQSWGYRVNGEEPLVGMADYQLKDGDILELFMLVF